MIKSDLSGFVVPIHLGLCEQYVKSLGLSASGFDFLFRTRPHALGQQTPPEPVFIPLARIIVWVWKVVWWVFCIVPGTVPSERYDHTNFKLFSIYNSVKQDLNSTFRDIQQTFAAYQLWKNKILQFR